MWMYLGPSYSERPFSTGLDGMEINAWIRGIIVQGADQNSSPSSVPLREGVIYLCQFLPFQHICILM
jgi:hypothetical protein